MMPCDGFTYQHLPFVDIFVAMEVFGSCSSPSKHTDPFGCCNKQQESKKKAKEAWQLFLIFN